MRKFTMLLAFLFVARTGFTQNLDSLVQSRHPDSLPGKIRTYYTPGKENVAARLQSLATAVANYYEKLFGTPFKVKLAVLDSANWPNGMAPYGIIFSHRGWIFMHSGMSFESFQNVYGMQNFQDVTQKALHTKKASGKQMVESFLEFYSAHELGHYFFNSLSGAKYPDYFTNEWMASYFAYQYFKKNKPSILPAFDLFCQLYRDNIKPNHTSVESFNSNWGDTRFCNMPGRRIYSQSHPSILSSCRTLFIQSISIFQVFLSTTS